MFLGPEIGRFQMSSMQEQIQEVEEEIRRPRQFPPHRQAESQDVDEIEKKSPQRWGKYWSKIGDGTVTLVGFPSVGNPRF